MKWILEILDKVSAPAKAGEQALKATEAEFSKVGEAANKAAEQGGGSMEGLATKIGLTTEGIHLVVEAAEKLGEKALEFGEFAAGAIDFKRNAIIGLAAITGSREQARQVVDEAEELATRAGLPVQETIKSYQALSAAKISAPNLAPLTVAASELSKMDPNSTFGGIIDAFKSISGKGQLAGRDLLQFKVIGEDLAHKLGSASFIDLQKKLQINPASARDGVRAILEVIQARAGGGALGGITAQVAGGIGGGLERIRGSVEKLVSGLAEDPAIEKLGATLGGIADSLGPGTASGRELRQTLSQVGTLASNLLTTVQEHSSDIATLFTAGAKAAGVFLDVLGPIVKALSFVASGKIGEQLAEDFESLTSKSSAPDNDVQRLRRGENLQKLASVDKYGAEDVQRLLAHSSEGSNRGDLFRLAREAGIPGYAGGGRVDSPSFVTVAENEPEYIIPESKMGALGGGGRAQISVSVDVGGIHVDGAGHVAPELAEIIEERLSTRLPGDLLSALELLGMQAG